MAAPLFRDMDFIRDLLIDIEGGKTAFSVLSVEDARVFGLDESEALSAAEAAKLEYHLDLLEDAGFIKVARFDSSRVVDTITWNGQEFLASVRDGEVWSKAKSGAKIAGNQSVAFVWELAKAYGKHLASERLGIKLG